MLISQKIWKEGNKGNINHRGSWLFNWNWSVRWKREYNESLTEEPRKLKEKENEKHWMNLLWFETRLW